MITTEESNQEALMRENEKEQERSQKKENGKSMRRRRKPMRFQRLSKEGATLNLKYMPICTAVMVATGDPRALMTLISS
jgi:hypothetical protein